MSEYFDGWITGHLPDRDGEFLVTVINDVNEATVCAASYKAGHWGTESKSNRLIVTAWAELPEPYSVSKSYEKGFAAGMAEVVREGIREGLEGIE